MSSMLILAPDVFGPPGGIARYIQLVCQALQSQARSVTLLSLLDGPESVAFARNAFLMTRYQPCSGSRSRFIREAISQAAAQRPDMVLVGHPNFAALGWFAAQVARARFAVFAYGIEVWQPLPPARRWGMRRAERVIAISRFTAQRAIATNGLAADRVRVLHNCLDPQWGPEPPGVRSEPPRPTLLAVARLSRLEQYKGHDIVLRALPKLVPIFPDLRFDIVGDGDWRPDLEALARELRVAQAVRFHGRVSHEELLQRYAEATLFVLPSRGEGFGFVFLEAMAQGLPVVAGTTDATPEVVVNGETGLLVDPLSPDAVAESVASLLTNRAQRDRMSIAAQRRAREHFSFVGFQHQLDEILEELDSRRSVAG